MKNFSGLGLGLSVVFGCLLLALIAELYYLLWWKKKRITDSTTRDRDRDRDRDIQHPPQYYYPNFAKHLFHFILRRKTQDPEKGHVAMPSSEKPILTGDELVNGSVDSELMRLHNLAGPPRFLFTIKEETREDMESEDGRHSRTRSLSDLMAVAASTSMDTPLILTPLHSPPLTLTVSNNPLFESATAESAELARLRSSPPPKFKFLRDAEEKLYRRLVQEAERKKALERVSLEEYCNNNNHNHNNVFAFVVGSENLPQYPSGSSQVLPLSSSPSAFKVQPILY